MKKRTLNRAMIIDGLGSDPRNLEEIAADLGFTPEYVEGQLKRPVRNRQVRRRTERVFQADRITPSGQLIVARYPEKHPQAGEPIVLEEYVQYWSR